MVNLETSIELAVDLVWLRGVNITHFAVIVVFYLFWRLPGSRKTSSPVVDVWYDALQNFPDGVLSGDDDDDESVVVSSSTDREKLSFEDDAWLASQLKESTPMERQRFFVAKNRDRLVAARSLRTYVEWRHKHAAIPSPPVATTTSAKANNDGVQLSADERLWNEVSLIALKARNEKRWDKPLPKVAFVHQLDGSDVCDKSGHRLFHFIPGRMDDRIASTVTYALAVALYIDKRLDPEGDEKVTVVIDVRGGEGWRNLNAAQLLPFVQHLTRLLLTMFPERLYRALVFPIPSRFFWVWRMARNCIDPLTREKICPLMGPSTIDSPPPMDQIAEYIGSDNALLLESKRKAGFWKL